MTTLPWLVGGSAAAAYLWWRDKDPSAPPRPASASSSPSASSPPPRSALVLPGRWVWPVAKWNDRRPVISDGVGSPRPGGRIHQGVDVMFRRVATDPFRPGTPNGAPYHVMPDNVVALAAGDGVIWSAGPTPRGFAVLIDHTPVKVATFYTHLEKLFVTPTSRAASGQRVRAGEPLGIIGFDPLDVGKLKHLHFEIWNGGPSAAIDPAPLMRTWEAIADPREPLGTRNASLVYRPVGSTGEAYPDWVRALKGKSGVYVIREVRGNGEAEIVYVGQSSANKLYETLTRHLQTWRRWKGFWRGQYSEHDPGLTYDRDRVEVAVRITTPAAALDEEARLIRRLRPRDNIIGQAVEEEVPF